MSGRDDVGPLARELDRWAEAGLTAAFWLRDDDAVADTPALRRLLSLASGHGAALMLAAIPLRIEPGLPELARRHACVRPAAHGVLHENHAGPEGRKEELAMSRGEADIRRALDSAREAFDRAFGMHSGPRWFVPPWNRIAPEVAAMLPNHGFDALSAWGAKHAPEQARLRQLNAHLDLIDWRGHRGGRDLGDLAREGAALLAARRAAGSAEPVGVLSHHLVHDDAADRALAHLAELVSSHPAARWLDVRELDGDGRRGMNPESAP